MKLQNIFILFLLQVSALAQEKFTIKGYVKDKKNGEALIGVVISKKGTSIGVSTNEYGFYSLTLPKGQYTLVTNYLGYKTIEKSVDLTQNLTLNFELEEVDNQLQEVEVSSEAEDKNVKSIEMSTVKLDIKQVEKIPALLGEVDVVRAVQLLPGVTTVGEGASGFNVRGGNVDQNLILLDDAPVFNSSHLFGFFSVFNPDAVKDLKLYKGGIPSQYGGRSSSVLDVRLKEGNNKQFEANGGIGTIFSRLSIEGPIKKEKSSFIIAGRRSYIDVLAKPILSKKQPNLKNAQFYFYDLTAKVNYRINDKNTVFLSGYFGRDVFGAGFTFDWGNATTTLRWNHIFNPRLFMNLTSFYSNYDYKIIFTQPGNNQKFEWRANIVNYSLKSDLSWYVNANNTVRFGIQDILYQFNPTTAIITDAEGRSTDLSLEKKYANELALYVSNEQKLNDRFTLEYGIRVSDFAYLGNTTKYTYRDTTPGIELPLQAEEKNDNFFKPIKNYIYPEPRFSANYVLNNVSSLKWSYNRMVQYIQIVSNTAATTPLDVYTPSTNNVKPLIADQISLGYFRNFKENMFETSVEVFYKYFQNQLDYIDNADLLINKYIESQFLQGIGRAYGLEVYIKKAKGKWNGWLSYTLSRTERKVLGISNNDWFLSKYDRTHLINFVNTYDFNKKWSASVTFVFLSGTPATFPDAKFQIQGYNVPYNTTNQRNNFRITPYHRLDVGVTWNIDAMKTKRFKNQLVLSVYNVYNRRNAYSIYFRTNPDNPNETQAVRFSVIGSIVPAITWNFNF
ncbi:MAG: collagen-binding protein [Bacteroidia bacterium]|nr:MAG: collagen-binding protein [Bacteroidia bacterium]